MAAWLALERETGGWIIADTGRMKKVVHGMGSPSSQRPSVQLFVGGPTKLQALRALNPHNNITRQSNVGFARLHQTNVVSPYSILVIESGLSPRPQEAWSRQKQDMTQRHHVQGSHSRTYQEMRDLLYREFLFPSAHVVCLFAADFGGIAQVKSALENWRYPMAPGFDDCDRILPRLVVVLTESEVVQQDIVATEESLAAAAKPRVAGSVIVVDLRDRSELSARSRFEPLRRALEREAEEARAARQDACLLFSAAHLQSLFGKMLLHVSQQSGLPFDCIRACRPSGSKQGDTSEYLARFMTTVEEARISSHTVAAFVASAFVMDAYPPGMHGFNPVLVFRKIYASDCKYALRNWTNTRAEVFCQRVEKEFACLHAKLSSAVQSIQIRKEVFRSQKSVWCDVKTNHVCLFCLRRPPEHMMPCRHTLCDTCACIFGQRSHGAEYHFDLACCPLCLTQFSFVVRVLPPTKGPTILVLDGGGIRGVVTLGFLKALEEEIGALRGAFDLTVGTSAGALNASEIMVCGSTANEAHKKFKAMAREIFPPTRRLPTILSQSLSLVKTWITDSRHDSTVLDQTLQRVFGATRCLFDWAGPAVSGVRVALTASRIEDGSLCLFSNYQGAERSKVPSAYALLVPNDLPLWEVARCTVAALGYFTPKYIEGLGTFQDGGVRVNCPLRTALRESEVLWPSRKRPDLVVSIGTGYASEGSSVDENSTHAFLKGGFIDRAIRTFLSSPAVDGRRGWKDALDSVPQDVQKNVFRLDRILPGELPELDDINAIDELDQHDYSISEELTKAWFAKALFFELDQEPTFLQNHYECRGSILCCKHDAAGIVKQIAARFPEARFALSRGSSLGDVDGEYGCSKCGYYRKRVSFKVSNLHETVDLGVTGTTGFISIGGFPTTVQCLLENQQADSPFGRSDHSRDRWPPSRGCYCNSRKRDQTSPDSDKASKRRRLSSL
ncbi:hypothetical protein KXV70_004079 [Aspergillus fumigatus]|nr:hypothetical protein KXV70_004079 [Aspergillus fumigatus]